MKHRPKLQLADLGNFGGGFSEQEGFHDEVVTPLGLDSSAFVTANKKSFVSFLYLILCCFIVSS